MARMTASDLVSFVRKGMGNPSTDEWTDTELLRLINLAQVDVATTHKPPELITATTVSAGASTYDYELSATDVLEITEVRRDFFLRFCGKLLHMIACARPAANVMDE